MAQQDINLGASANDGTGDPLRVGGGKINDNFTELYGRSDGNIPHQIIPARVNWSNLSDTVGEVQLIWAAVNSDIRAIGVNHDHQLFFRTLRNVYGQAGSLTTYDIYETYWLLKDKLTVVDGSNVTLGSGQTQLTASNGLMTYAGRKITKVVNGSAREGGFTVDFGATGATPIEDLVSAAGPYDTSLGLYLFKGNDGTEDYLYIYNGTEELIGTGTGVTLGASDFTILTEATANPAPTNAQTIKLQGDTGSGEFPLAIDFVGADVTENVTTGHGVVTITGGGGSVPDNAYTPQTVSQSKVLALSDKNGLLRVDALANIIIPEDTEVTLPLGYRTIVKRATTEIVGFFGQLGVTIEIPDGFDALISNQYEAVELVKEAANTWGVYGALKNSNPETGTLPYPLVLDVAQTTLADVAWAYVYKSSEYPLVTTTKDYFVIYSTDHDTAANGAIAWGEMDDPEFNGFEQQGIIVQNGFQSEFADLIFIPAAESGLANDELFLYFHTQGEPGSTLGQETRLWTTVGGAPLHTATWTDRGFPLTPEAGDNHNGYLRIWKRGVSDYLAHHLIIQGGAHPFTDQQAWATTPDGQAFTRGGTYSTDLNMPAGGYFWRLDINPIDIGGTLYGLINYNNAGIFLALVTLDPATYLPATFVKTLVNVTFSDYTMYEVDDVIYIYFRNKDFTNTTFPIDNSLYVLKLDKNSLV